MFFYLRFERFVVPYIDIPARLPLFFLLEFNFPIDPSAVIFL
jgi:hypothetical protein